MATPALQQSAQQSIAKIELPRLSVSDKQSHLLGSILLSEIRCRAHQPRKLPHRDKLEPFAVDSRSLEPSAITPAAGCGGFDRFRRAVDLRVRPETSGRIAEFSEHEAD